MLRKVNTYLWLLTIISMIGTSSCQNGKYKNEMKQLDSLENLVNSATKSFNIDEKVIRVRKQDLEEKLKFIQLNAQDTFSLELANALGELRGIRKIYSAYLDRHKEIEKETDELKVQVETLRYSLRKEEITLEQFISFYEKERQDIIKNRQDVENIHERVFSVEPLYKRLVPLMDAEVDRLREAKGEKKK